MRARRCRGPFPLKTVKAVQPLHCKITYMRCKIKSIMCVSLVKIPSEVSHDSFLIEVCPSAVFVLFSVQRWLFTDELRRALVHSTCSNLLPRWQLEVTCWVLSWKTLGAPRSASSTQGLLRPVTRILINISHQLISIIFQPESELWAGGDGPWWMQCSAVAGGNKGHTDKREGKRERVCLCVCSILFLL